MTNEPRHPDLIRCMTAFRDIADYLSDNAARLLDDEYATRYPNFYCAFLDDDSDYMPAALDMMRELMTALSDDNPDDAAIALIARIRRNDYMITIPEYRYTDLPFDFDIDPDLLPLADIDID